MAQSDDSELREATTLAQYALHRDNRKEDKNVSRGSAVG
jgi:hypothetical protein